MNRKQWRRRVDIVYSTDPEYEYRYDQPADSPTLPPGQQHLSLRIDRKGRKGKTATIITGFAGKTADLEQLAKKIKTLCAAGGSVKDGEILIQGDFREKIAGFLKQEGYRFNIPGR